MSAYVDVTDDQLAERVIAALVASGRRIAVAESLTGGLLTAALVGSPAHRVRSWAASSPTTRPSSARSSGSSPRSSRSTARSTRTWRGRWPAASDRHARSTETRRHRRLDDGRGRSRPQDGQPPGTAFVGLSIDGDSRAIALHLDGDRQAVRAGVVRAALAALVDALEPGGNI